MDLKIIIIGLAIILIIGFILFLNKPKKMEYNEIIIALGGIENIVNVKKELSRVKVELKDMKKANHQDLMKYGANGIFEVNNELQIILNENSESFFKKINNSL